jgi:hypothetical protein
MVSNNGGIPDASMLKKDVLHVSALTTIRAFCRGYVKYQFNTETHRNYLSKHRSSDVQSAEYSASQEFYIERGAKNAMNGKLEYEYFRLQKLEKMFWNRTYGHVRIIYFQKLTSMLMVNVL